MPTSSATKTAPLSARGLKKWNTDSSNASLNEIKDPIFDEIRDDVQNVGMVVEKQQLKCCLFSSLRFNNRWNSDMFECVLLTDRLTHINSCIPLSTWRSDAVTRAQRWLATHQQRTKFRCVSEKFKCQKHVFVLKDKRFFKSHFEQILEAERKHAPLKRQRSHPPMIVILSIVQVWSSCTSRVVWCQSKIWPTWSFKVLWTGHTSMLVCNQWICRLSYAQFTQAVKLIGFPVNWIERCERKALSLFWPICSRNSEIRSQTDSKLHRKVCLELNRTVFLSAVESTAQDRSSAHNLWCTTGFFLLTMNLFLPFKPSGILPRQYINVFTWSLSVKCIFRAGTQWLPIISFRAWNLCWNLHR